MKNNNSTNSTNSTNYCCLTKIKFCNSIPILRLFCIIICPEQYINYPTNHLNEYITNYKMCKYPKYPKYPIITNYNKYNTEIKN